jgi:hypothetical protein
MGRAPQGRSEGWAKDALAMLVTGDGGMQIVANQERDRLRVVEPAWLSRPTASVG